MCYFLCVALSEKGNAEAAKAAFERQGIALSDLASNVNAGQFEPGTRFFVSSSICECGHPLGNSRPIETEPKSLTPPDPRWSEARKQRWRDEKASHEAPPSTKDEETLLAWRRALCEALVRAKADWIGVYGTQCTTYVDIEPLELTFHRIRLPEDLSTAIMGALPHRTVLKITPHVAAQVLVGP